MKSLPELDLAPFLADPESPSGLGFVTQLRTACHEIGFAHLVGHGIDPLVEGEVLRCASDFFALPLAERLQIVNTNSAQFRGYTRLGHEFTNGSQDQRDQIDLGPEHTVESRADYAAPWSRLRGPNQWPAQVPEMRPIVSEWMSRMAIIGEAVLRALALGLGQPGNHFASLIGRDPEVLVKIIRYPAASDGGSDQGVGPHHDSGLLTFIMQDGVGGLQVLSGSEFIDVQPQAGAYVLNLGEMLQLATHGYLRATKHRVISPPPGRQRISVAYFFNPDMDSILQPVVLPAALAEHAPGGQNADPKDPVFERYGQNWLKFRLRSHPDVAAIHHPDLVAQTGIPRPGIFAGEGMTGEEC